MKVIIHASDIYFGVMCASFSYITGFGFFSKEFWMFVVSTMIFGLISKYEDK